nr:ADP-ribose glycohydrolase OARD1 isoform X3 [Chlorocebus sabaeus]
MASSLNEDPEGSRITYVKGDLFACPKTDSLAHCISEDCRMGAGIAVLFKKKFGGVQELLNQRFPHLRPSPKCIHHPFHVPCCQVRFPLWRWMCLRTQPQDSFRQEEKTQRNLKPQGEEERSSL